MKKFMERVCLGSLILLVPVSGFACSMDQWTSQSGAVTAASPPTLPRVSEFCAMQATNTGYVHDSSPVDHATFIARFYVRSTLTGSGQADVFVAYDADSPGNQLLKVSYDGANLDFHSTSGTQLGTAAAISGKWHLVEVEYNSAGNTRFWVNANAVTGNGSPTGTYTSATGEIESVRLGLPNGRGTFSGGGVSFDAYESHSTTPVGPLKIGDANGDDTWNIFDYGAVQQDIAENLQIGQPDCNLDGGVNIFDYGCVQTAIANN
jgi:hypothetical protein